MRAVTWFSCSASVLLLSAVLFPCALVHASITIVDTGEILASRPETKLGQRLWKGYEYMGRFQLVRGNLQLCKSSDDPSRRFQIKAPTDGLPVALYAKTGGCTLEEKAIMASTMIDPPNAVGYLIVDDFHGRKKTLYFGGEDDGARHDSTIIDHPFWVETSGSNTDEDLAALWDGIAVLEDHQEQLQHFEAIVLPPLEASGERGTKPGQVKPFVVEALVNDAETATPVLGLSEEGFILSDLDTDDLSASDDEMVPVPLKQFRVKTDETAWWDSLDTGDDEPYDDGHHGLRKSQHHNNINVAILHVNHQVGYELLDLLVKESTEKREVGGPKVLLNGKGNTSAKNIFLWTVLTIVVSSTACCCLLFFIGYLEEPENNAPPQPVRRRLTHNQVREKYPAFHFQLENHVEQPLDDECAICLDDFDEGTRLRKLPCGHVFHATCIARWLIERSAVCPLCKVDLYEEEEVDEDNESQASAEAPEPNSRLAQSLMSWWSARNGAEPNTAANTTAASPDTNDTPDTRSGLWWSRPSSATTADEATTNDTVPTPPPARAFRWPFRQRRRGTSAGMVTELTEPLLSPGESNGEAIEAASPAVEESGEIAALIPASSSEQAEPIATTNEARATQPTSAEADSPPSAPVEV